MMEDMNREIKKASFLEAEKTLLSKYSMNLDSYKIALEQFFIKYGNCAAMAVRISDGEILDRGESQLIMDELILSYRVLQKIKSSFCGDAVFNPAKLILPSEKDVCAMRGNELLGSYATSKKLEEYEKGKWYLYSAIA